VYHELLRQHIRDTLEYPSVVRRRGLTGTVEVEILVRSDGAIRDVTLVRSSSSRTLDDAAVAAVKQLPRLRFPPGLAPRALRVLVPVVFDLK
jgi:protein TonB